MKVVVQAWPTKDIEERKIIKHLLYEVLVLLEAIEDRAQIMSHENEMT